MRHNVVMSMSIQRSRRAFLGTLGSVGLGGIAGCLGTGDSVQVLAAGSLVRTFEEYIGPAFTEKTGIDVHGEYYGSKAVMRMVTDRTKHPDVVVSADATLLREHLYEVHTTWDVEFATNVLGLGFNADTPFGSNLKAGKPWYECLLESASGDIIIGDPALDPLGYRALQAFELANQAHGLDGFRDAAEDVVYEEPDEAQMLAQVETGARAGAICYENMAVDHGHPFLAFPPAYNFAVLRLANHYATAEVTIGEEDITIEGRPILYNTTVLDTADNTNAGRRLVQFLIDKPGLLNEAGLSVSERLPQSVGTVPQEIAV